MSRLLLPIAALILLSFTLWADAPRANPFRGDSAAPAVPEAEGDRDFKNGDYRKAAEWYAGVAAADATVLGAEQKNAWAYCRIKLAAEAINSPGDAQAAAAIEKDVAEALALAPGNAELQKLGQAVQVLARQRQVAAVRPPGDTPSVGAAPSDKIETTSFTVQFTGSRDIAEKVAEAAEKKRVAIFERWSGPAGRSWSPRCAIVLHASAERYAAATGQPAAGMGHATVRLVDGKVTERRIDLRQDDEGLYATVLPRELTHVVLADLFPFTPPPRWAEEGMAVLAGSPDEIDRYLRTCVKCGREGKLFTLAALFEMKDFPRAEKITGFCCGSVSLVDYLVKLKGEKHFTTFLRDCQRYGSVSALKRQYDIDSPKALQAAWLKSAIK
jgi:hypothetical protein